jgi:nitrogen fixation NifU-like protein
MPKTSFHLEARPDQTKLKEEQTVYSETIRDHARNPRNRSQMEQPDAVGQAQYRRCGDKLTMFFRIKENSIQEASFTARGCGPVVAAASLATTIVKGRTVEEARQLDAFQLYDELGGMPVSKRHALLLVLQCLAEALGARTQ